MFRRSFVAALLATLGLAATTLPTARADEAGNALARQVRDRPIGKDSYTEGQMILIEQGHTPRARRMRTYQLEPREDEQWTLIRFLEPTDIADTGLLTLDHADADTDQWVFLPAVKKARRIPADRRGGNFVGSDLIYEDLRDRKVEQDTHTITGEELVGKAMCKVLESVPVDAKNSEYSKRISWVHPQTLVALRVDFYQGGSEPVKRMEVKRLQKVQGFWTILETEITDLKTRHSTRMLAESVRYDVGLPESMFNQGVLEDPVQERTLYKP